MGNNLFGARIAEKIAAALGSRLLAGQLVRVTQSELDTTDPAATPTEITRRFPFRGIYDNFDQRRFGDTGIREGSRIVLILGATLPANVVPRTDDRVTLEGETTTIVGPVIRDPDRATYLAEVSS